MTNPGVVIELVALEVVPLIGRVIAGGVVVDLACADGAVSVFTKVDGNGAEVGKIRFPPLLVVEPCYPERKFWRCRE